MFVATLSVTYVRVCEQHKLRHMCIKPRVSFPPAFYDDLNFDIAVCTQVRVRMVLDVVRLTIDLLEETFCYCEMKGGGGQKIARTHKCIGFLARLKLIKL